MTHYETTKQMDIFSDLLIRGAFMRITNGLDNCPHCLKQVLYNALRCPHCGETLKSYEETLTPAERLRLIAERQRRQAKVKKLVTLAVLTAIGLAWWTGALHSVVRF